jgi:hypothetical protein
VSKEPIDLRHLKELDQQATPGPWWNESGVIHAKAPDWTPECHSCCHPVRCDEDDDAELVAEYRNETPRLIGWAAKVIPLLEGVLPLVKWNEDTTRQEMIEALLKEVQSCPS